MASQYKVLVRQTAAVANAAITGKGRIRLLVLYGAGANATASVTDTGASAAMAEVSALAGTTTHVPFDNAGGGLPFSTGLTLTVTGSGAVLYVYGS